MYQFHEICIYYLLYHTNKKLLINTFNEHDRWVGVKSAKETLLHNGIFLHKEAFESFLFDFF